MNKNIVSLKHPFLIVLSLVIVALAAIFITRFTAKPLTPALSKPADELFLAPGRGWDSEKKVEAYFINNLHMTPEEANSIRSKPGVDGKIMLRIRERTTLEALLSNLEYYGFVRDKEALRYALEHSADNDTAQGKASPLVIGNNTIATWAYYRISEDMTAWEIADELLNHPTHFSFDQYNYTFMP
ncbi:hypothetical protein H3C66_04980 [Patescibacteria group bacterium]|jgi:cell division protein YceG involved in septum cleavage|nr:hypothetical protein [Patescibacteria group bacterium]